MSEEEDQDVYGYCKNDPRAVLEAENAALKARVAELSSCLADCAEALEACDASRSSVYRRAAELLAKAT